MKNYREFSSGSIEDTKDKILLIGHAQHGKDTVAHILGQYMGLKYIPTSYLLSTLFMFDALKDKYGYKTAMECYEDRHTKREVWVDLIHSFNQEDPSKLVREVIIHNDFYVGLRDINQFEATKHLFKYIIWVENPSKEKEIYMNIDRENAHFVINNNADIYQLRERLFLLKKC